MSARAVQLKEEGNKCFQGEDYLEAEKLYSKAINLDQTNPLLYTNRAMARLKLHLDDSAISDCLASLELLQHNMKAYFYMAHAELELGRKRDALASAKMAYDLTAAPSADIRWQKSMPSVVALVLRCKKEIWDIRERERLGARGERLEKVLRGLDLAHVAELGQIKDLRAAEKIEEVACREMKQEADEAYAKDVEEVRRTWDKAADVDSGEKVRVVPDWIIDDITFAVMHDPVITKTGHSYERAALLEHLRHSATDPLTREPLRLEELRPNLGLKAACEEFLKDNGWAVDW